MEWMKIIQSIDFAHVQQGRYLDCKHRVAEIFCRNFARLLRLRESVAPVEVLDARSGDPRLLAYQRRFA
jgi:hypothetical protein